MSSLRQEYQNRKTRQNQIISDAAFNWLKSNVILINEKIDRSTVTRLIDSIQKFEDTFGPFRDRLPSIANQLQTAEAALNMVITGRLTDKKTSNLLEQLTYLYSAFSDFFTRDLPVLLRTKLFMAAKDNPDVPLNRLAMQAGGFDGNTVKEAFANALRPSAEEKKLLRKIYRSTALPKLDTTNIASQMMALTYNDLQELTAIGKVPMTVADVEGGEVEEELPMEAIAKKSGENFINEEVAGNIVSRANEIMTENERLVFERKFLMEVNVQEIQPGLDALKKVVSAVDALEPLRGPINDLQSKVLAALADGDVKTYLSQATSSANPVNVLKNLFQSPQGKIISQANMAIETLKNVSNTWGQIQPILNKDEITAPDIANIKKILTSGVKGGALKRIGSLFKTQPFPGLTPDDVLNALFRPLDEYLAQPEAGADVMQAKIEG